MVLVAAMTAPLAGIRVLEVANWLAAPAAGALLADLGADVIKVEPPGGSLAHRRARGRGCARIARHVARSLDAGRRPRATIAPSGRA